MYITVCQIVSTQNESEYFCTLEIINAFIRTQYHVCNIVTCAVLHTDANTPVTAVYEHVDLMSNIIEYYRNTRCAHNI